MSPGGEGAESYLIKYDYIHAGVLASEGQRLRPARLEAAEVEKGKQSRQDTLSEPLVTAASRRRSGATIFLMRLRLGVLGRRLGHLGGRQWCYQRRTRGNDEKHACCAERATMLLWQRSARRS